LTVGKEVTFTSIYSLPPNEDIPRDLGYAEIGGVDLSTELLKAGWVKTKEIKREPTEDDTKKRDLENESKAASRGMWTPQPPKVNYFEPFEKCKHSAVHRTGQCITPCQQIRMHS